jgi:two-component system chemotaxis sensor kinase CheA
VKLPLATVLVVAAVTALTYVALTRFERENLLRAKESAAQMMVELFAEAVSAPVVFEDPIAITDTLAYLAHNEEVLSGYVWRGDADAPEVLGSYERTPGAAPTFRSEGVWRSDGELAVTMPVRDSTHAQIAQATVVFSLARENEAFAVLSTRILVSAAAIAALLTLVLAMMSRRTIVRPLVSLVSLARALEEGEVVQVVSQSNDEIGRLGSALTRMASAVASREQAIAAKNADLRRVLDNVRQGFLILDRDGRLIGERSAMVDTWLDGAGLGASFASILGAVDPIVGDTFDLAWESLIEGIMPLDLCLSQLPSKLRKGDQHLRIEYRIVGDEEQFDAVMVVISDVTSEIERAQAEAQQRELMAAVTRFVADRAGFLSFLEEGTALRDRIAADTVEGPLLMRDVHTLKGISAMNGADRVAGVCHEIENAAAERGDLPTRAERETIAEAWDSLASCIRPLDTATAEGRVELTAREIEELVRAMVERAPYATLLAMVEGWSGEPVDVRLRQLAEEARRLARRLGKPDPDLVIDAASLRAPAPWAPFWSQLVHLTRNAVDHGIETSAARQAAGKSAHGSLTLAAARTDSGMTITIADDGAGIDWTALAAKAKAKGLRADTHEALVDALFADGVSTRAEVSDVSGRGVGLAALRDCVRSMGGEVRVESTRGKGARFEIRLPIAPKLPSQRPPAAPRAPLA